MIANPGTVTVTESILGNGCGCCGDVDDGCPGTCAYEWTGSRWELVDDPNDCTHQGTDPVTGLTKLCACEPPPMHSGQFIGELHVGHCGIDLFDSGPT